MAAGFGRVFGGIVFACIAFHVMPDAAAQGGQAARSARSEPVVPLEEQLRRQQDRILALEAEAAFERRRAEAVAGYANRRVADAVAATEQRARDTAADLEHLRAEHQRELDALRRLYEESSRRASDAEQAGWIWGAVALPLGAAAGWFLRRRRDAAQPPAARHAFTPGEFAAFLSRRRADDQTVA